MSVISLIPRVTVLSVDSYGPISGQWCTHFTRCNKETQCAGGLDEKYCTAEEVVFSCIFDHDVGIASNVYQIPTSSVCDRECDCYHCDDEWNCNGYIYHYWYKCYNSSRRIASYRM